jgi:hypothetical protein
MRYKTIKGIEYEESYAPDGVRIELFPIKGIHKPKMVREAMSELARDRDVLRFYIYKQEKE